MGCDYYVHVYLEIQHTNGIIKDTGQLTNMGQVIKITKKEDRYKR